MFYSHEMLTSPEHGVATIWLVATLGSRSITRRVNRRAILDVDVPEACRVIVNPGAPMALRLQGNLLYGVSRVFGQQCDYALLDAEAMRDKLRSTLKSFPGGGLDPSAGKAKPNTLLLPYDPSFLPEANLPGLNMDFDLFDVPASGPSQFGSLLDKSPPGSYSSNSRLSVHLELGSDDVIYGEGVVQEYGEGLVSNNRGIFGQATRGDFGDDEGILLEPDFEFDETGAIVEHDSTQLSPRKRRRIDDDNDNEEWVPTAGQDDDPMDLTADVTATPGDALMDFDTPGGFAESSIRFPVTVEEDILNEERISQEENLEPTLQRRTRRIKVKNIDADANTTLRNTDLARWNDEYVANMEIASKQKKQTKQHAVVKQNAKYCVFGQGIGSVGRGLGALHEDHPLKKFSGDALWSTFVEKVEQPPPEIPLQLDDFSPPTTTQQARHFEGLEGLDSIDVEMGRHAPSSVLDERSSLMPWNMTTSVRSSRHSRIGSISELSARYGETSIGGKPLARSSRYRGRFPNASPLEENAWPDLQEELERLDYDGGDLDEELEISRYLESELADDVEGIEVISRRASAIRRVAGLLDQESLNFFEYIQTSVCKQMKEDVNGGGVLAFSELLPVGSTSPAVATQGLMNVLTLATKGLLVVKQEDYQDTGVDDYGCRFDYGEIFMRL